MDWVSQNVTRSLEVMIAVGMILTATWWCVVSLYLAISSQLPKDAMAEALQQGHCLVQVQHRAPLILPVDQGISKGEDGVRVTCVCFTSAGPIPGRIGHRAIPTAMGNVKMPTRAAGRNSHNTKTTSVKLHALRTQTTSPGDVR